MCTGSNPAVRSVTTAAAATGSMLSVTGSMSQKTGVTPSYSRQLAEETKLNGLVTTSSPEPQPKARTPRWSAVVPEETATASSDPILAAKSRSNRSSMGPSDRRPERRTSRTSSSSRGPRSGHARGICSDPLIAAFGGLGTLWRTSDPKRFESGRRSTARGYLGAFPRCPGLAIPRLERVLQRIHERLPRGLDDVLRDADRAPCLPAIGRIEQHARHRASAVVRVQNPDLVVDELDLRQVRVELGDRGAQGPVERVDRPVALGRTQEALSIDPDLDRRLGLDLAVR